MSPRAISTPLASEPAGVGARADQGAHGLAAVEQLVDDLAAEVAGAADDEDREGWLGGGAGHGLLDSGRVGVGMFEAFQTVADLLTAEVASVAIKQPRRPACCAAGRGRCSRRRPGRASGAERGCCRDRGLKISAVLELGRDRQRDLRADVGHHQLAGHRSQVLDGADPALRAVRDEPDCLVVPLGEQVPPGQAPPAHRGRRQDPQPDIRAVPDRALVLRRLDDDQRKALRPLLEALLHAEPPTE